LNHQGASGQPLTRGLRVDADIGNVTDKNYAPYQTGVSAPGRNFKVLASYAFGA
jgi:hypothetical protein